MGYFLQKYQREVGGHRLFVTVLQFDRNSQINVKLKVSLSGSRLLLLSVSPCC